jgi:FkbM family methyltransferase
MKLNAAVNDIGRFVSLCQSLENNPPRLLSKDKPVWIFGAGNFGRDICRILQNEGYEVGGFVETKPNLKTIQGLPVLSWPELKPQHIKAQLALGIFNRNSAFDELQTIAKAGGYGNVFLPWDLYGQFGKDLGWRFWLSQRNMLLSNLQRIGNVCLRLADDESKTTLLRICAFRLGLDIAYSSFRHTEEQYFNQLTLPQLSGEGIVYVDCGAYNGDSYLDLIDRPQITCDMAFLIEPDPVNYNALVNAVSHRGNVVCLPLAVAQNYTILTFNAGQGEGGAISESGNIHVAASALDQLIPNLHVDFIKLDVEGGESHAIKGAVNLIQRSRPVLAISLYHRPEDIWLIPELLFEICPEYNFFIRQHYYNSFDSVLYVVPK